MAIAALKRSGSHQARLVSPMTWTRRSHIDLLKSLEAQVATNTSCCIRASTATRYELATANTPTISRVQHLLRNSHIRWPLKPRPKFASSRCAWLYYPQTLPRSPIECCLGSDPSISRPRHAEATTRANHFLGGSMAVRAHKNMAAVASRLQQLHCERHIFRIGPCGWRSDLRF
jgi:hypothetical protein